MSDTNFKIAMEWLPDRTPWPPPPTRSPWNKQASLLFINPQGLA